MANGYAVESKYSKFKYSEYYVSIEEADTVSSVYTSSSKTKKAYRRVLSLALVLAGALVARRLFANRMKLESSVVPPDSWPPIRPAATVFGRPRNDTHDSLVGEEERSTAGPADPAPLWVNPLEQGKSCPISHPIKAKRSSMIYHVPGSLAYDRTIADRCYATEEAARADGFRRTKR